MTEFGMPHAISCHTEGQSNIDFDIRIYPNYMPNSSIMSLSYGFNTPDC